MMRRAFPAVASSFAMLNVLDRTEDFSDEPRV
ncbi:hypothetical protein C8N30_2376 [Sulfitobacter guttiformis]|uniref:Uncharacterized protein n=1 Tax=Sulfitobacter guttiformis TaxID=74349 RepID=A0A420DU93_9RHOB|nr:hypothetical protein C8N30_2376 [Sulfitobacter guttiformis]